MGRMTAYRFMELRVVRDTPYNDIGCEIMDEVSMAWRDCESMRKLLAAALPHVVASARAQHLLDGFRPKVRLLDTLVQEIREALQ